jgi:DNA polymerase III delta subunit
MTQAITDDDRESIMGNNSVAKNYDLIDAIMEKDIKKSLNLFRKISSSKSMFEFLPGFI